MGAKIKKIIIYVMVVIVLFVNETLVYATKEEYYNKSIAEKDKANFYNLTMDDGLTNNNITDIYQDSRGYIWIGTEDGLNQYNGNIIIQYNYESDNKNTISSPYITKIIESPNGDIWVGSNGGLSIINVNENKIKRIDEKEFNLSHSVITDIYKDSNNVMWVGTSNGLNRYDEESNKFINYYANDTNKSINNNYITDIEEDDLGYLWVSTIEGTVAIKLNTYEIFNEKNESNLKYIYQMDKDNEGNIWNVGKDSIYKVIVGEDKFYKYQIDIDDVEYNEINKVLCSSNDKIWFGGFNGLIEYNQNDNSTKIYKSNKNLSNYILSDFITCLYEDGNGVLWIGTDSGISILNPSQQFRSEINTILSENGICDYNITSIFKDEDDDLWIGTQHSGVILYKLRENKIIRFTKGEGEENSLFSNTIKDIQEGINKYIVITNKGINTIDKETEEVFRVTEYKKNNIFFEKDIDVLKDDKSIWLSTYNGLYRKDNQSDEIINYNYNFSENGINDFQLIDMCQDENDEDIIWIAGGRNVGLIKFHKSEGVIKNYLLSHDLLGYNGIKCIESDGQGNMWIGTEVGLNKFNIENESFTSYLEKDGLMSDYIKSINIDDDKNIWLGTSNGLIKFIVNENRFINFMEIDGICSSNFNNKVKYKGKNGTLLFGTTNGVVEFNPSEIKEIKSCDEKVKIGGYWIDSNKSVNDEEKITLKSNNNIAFEYFLPDYSRIGDITYLYKLEGLNSKWNQGNSDGYVLYSGLKAGKYNFKVKAVKGDGSLTEETSISFKIEGNFWKTKMAYFLYIVVVVIIILYFIYRMKFFKVLVHKQTKEINNKMEENKKLYEQNIKNEKFKNDYFVNLSHELRTPLNVILSVLQLLSYLDKNDKASEEKNKHYMDVIKKSSNSLLHIINDIIDSSKIESGAYKINKEENIDIVYLVEETALNMKDYIGEKGIELIIDPEIEELEICCDPKEIERCIVNLIGNAVKFTDENGEIKVLIKENDNTVSISVEDNGVGISKDDQEFIFNRFEQGSGFNSTKVSSSGIGLTLVKNIVELHNGDIKLESELEKGSKFTIVLPVS